MRTALLVAAYLVAVIALIIVWSRAVENVFWTRVALGVILVASLAHQAVFNTSAEDAFISYRYAENLADGHGLVFNIGERVEGYSNFLWTVMLAGLKWAVGLDVVAAARLLGVVATLAAIVLTYLLARRLACGDRGAGLLAALLVAASGSVAAYGRSGLETPLFMALALAAVVMVLDRRFVVAGALLALTVMTRPDGVVVAAVILVWTAWRSEGEARSRVRSAALVAVPMLAVLAPWTIWRVGYYGHFLPNALAAKSGQSLPTLLDRGVDYIGDFGSAVQPLLLLAVVAFVIALRSLRTIDRAFRRRFELVTALIVLMTMTVLVVGGDWMPAWRFLAPVIPFLAVFVVATWTLGTRAEASLLAPSGRSSVIIFGAVALLLFATSFADDLLIPRVRTWSEQVNELSEIGLWFERTLPLGTTVATYANGALSFHAGPSITMIDELGLTDEHIARHGDRVDDAVVGHAAQDWQYIRARRPDIFTSTGTGFDSGPSCVVPSVLDSSYVGLSFAVPKYGAWVNLSVPRTERNRIRRLLDADPAFDHVPCPRGA